MCEQAARYCRAGVQRLLRKPPPALRGLDGLLRWVVARMGDKGVAERELLTPGAAAAAVQRKGTSVILDVSGSPLQPPGMHPAARIPPAPRLRPLPLPASCHRGGGRGFLGSLHPLHWLGNGLYPGSCNPRLGGRGGRILVPCAGPAAADWAGVGMQPGSRSPLPGSRTHPASSEWALFPEFCIRGAAPGSSISRSGWARGCTPAPAATEAAWAGERTAAPAPSLPGPCIPPTGLASGLFLGSCTPLPVGDGGQPSSCISRTGWV